ncbi:peptide ABC transporter substrate-binding protein [Paenisporosarcina indica]|uniref:peptide ABC transporter substrate-binding protein n=1 Tax=Paenisporosarcina indica TaxID=650093 RepID=UPI00094FBBE3|nr:peptide ABC transporter substrate-binding protein [Paenisporosarcina indica]
MRIINFTFVIILALLLSACTNGENPQEHVTEIYSVALNSIMKEDPGLNDDMDYIAVDFTNINDLAEKEKEEIVSTIQKEYGVDVMIATFEELKEKGLSDLDTGELYGVLLKLDKVDFKLNNEIFFEASKYRSGLGAIGVEGTIHFIDGEWEIKELTHIWMS